MYCIGAGSDAVADDQLALPATDGNHRVDRLDAGLQGLLDWLPDDDARCRRLHLPRDGRDDVAFSIDWTPERIDHSPYEGRANGDLEDPRRASDLVPFL